MTEHAAKMYSDQPVQESCITCYMGSTTLMLLEKSLKKQALEQFGKNTVEAIVARGTEGKNAMAKVRRRLHVAEIQFMTLHVLEQG